jgi:hypothetical protein
MPAWAQETALAGTVADPTGAVVPGAEVIATNQATGAVRTTHTGADGKYLFTQMAPGTYKIEVKSTGFKSAQAANVAVPISVTTRFDVTLAVGDVAETITVESETARINTTDASLGTPFSGDELRNLPSLDLNPAGLLSLQTGVTFVAGQLDPGGYGSQSTAEHRTGSVSGSRSDQTNITLDGVDVNDPITGQAFFSALRVTQESLQEFRVTTTNYNAEQGRSSAAQVSLVTKSGTNDIHGSAYYLHRNEAFNANDFFLNSDGTPEGKFRRHLYGASLGGPIIKNRFFLFGNWERNEESLFESGERSVPSLAMRDGVFIYSCTDRAGFATCPRTDMTVTGVSGATYTVTQPAGCDATSGNPCLYGLSPAEIDALDRGGPGVSLASLAAWATLPEPNFSGSSDGINILGFRFAAPISNTFNTYIARADIHIDRNANHTVFWRGTLQDDAQLSAPNLLGGSPFRSILIANKGFSLGYTAVLSATMVNNFRWGVTRIKDASAGNRNTEFVRHRFLDDTLGFFNQEQGTSSSFGRIIPQNHFRNDFSWTRGKHVMSFGAEARYTRNSRFSDGGSFHVAVINPSWLPDGGGEIQPGQTNCGATRPECAAVPNAVGRMRDQLTVLIAPLSQVTASYNFDSTGATQPAGEAVRRRFAVDEYEWYAQDQWRLFNSFTVNYGVRYYYATPPWETNGNQVVPNPRISDWIKCRENAMETGQASSLACGHLEMVLGGKKNNGRPYYDEDFNNFSPRVGFAWAPNNLGWVSGQGKLTIRAGYSLVYDRIGNALAVNFDQVGSFGMATSLSNGLGSCSISGLIGGFPALCPRFTGYLDTTAAFAGATPGPPPAPQNLGLQPSPGGGFPAVQPLNLSGVSSTIDDRLRTPYSHAANVSVARELPWNMVIEGAWVMRRGVKLPIARDYAMQADLRDPASGVTWFEAQRLFVDAAANGVTLANIGTIPYWENLFPAWGPTGSNGGCLGFQVLGSNPAGTCGSGQPGAGFSATQVAYDYLMGWHGINGSPDFGASTMAEDIDRLQILPSMSCPQGTDVDGDGFTDCRYAIFPGQFVQLRGLTGISRSEYSSMQISLRKRESHGLTFNLNYTLSTSKDHASVPERQGTGGSTIGAGYSGFMVNSWDLSQQWGYSDYDMRHQFNSHVIYQLPFGRGKMWAADVPGWANQVIGGWSLSGIFRANSGLPLTVINGRSWPTNWNFQGNAVCQPSGDYILGLSTGPCPGTQNVKSSTRGTANAFADPDAAFAFFRYGAPGESGGRNQMRGDKYINVDLAIAKSFGMPWEGHKLDFRWEVFNFFNSAYFDTGEINASIGDQATFGDYTAVLGGPRRMQVYLRYTF